MIWISGIWYRLAMDSMVLMNWLSSLAFLSNIGTLSMTSLVRSEGKCLGLHDFTLSICKINETNDASELVSGSIGCIFGMAYSLASRCPYLVCSWLNVLTLSCSCLCASVCFDHSILKVIFWCACPLPAWMARFMIHSSFFALKNCSGILRCCSIVCILVLRDLAAYEFDDAVYFS